MLITLRYNGLVCYSQPIALTEGGRLYNLAISRDTKIVVFSRYSWNEFTLEMEYNLR